MNLQGVFLSVLFLAHYIECVVLSPLHRSLVCVTWKLARFTDKNNERVKAQMNDLAGPLSGQPAGEATSAAAMSSASHVYLSELIMFLSSFQATVAPF
jgi:hypothetical protein